MTTKPIQSVEIHGIQTLQEENEWVYLQTETLLKHGFLQHDVYNLSSVLEAAKKFVVKEYDDVISVDRAFVAIAFYAGGRMQTFTKQEIAQS